MTLHCNSHETMESGSDIQTSLPVWMAFKRLTFDRPVGMPC